MSHTNLNRALVLTATLLAATTAFADPPDHANAGGKAAEVKAEKADKADKAEAKVEKTAAGLAGKADMKEDAKIGDRAARRAAQHEQQKEKLRGMLKAPMDEAMKQELRRHAERVAKIERIQSLANEAKDKDTAERATKLLEKEKARHEKFLATQAKVEKNMQGGAAMAPNAANPTPNTAAPNTTPTPAPKADEKGGAK